MDGVFPVNKFPRVFQVSVNPVLSTVTIPMHQTVTDAGCYEDTGINALNSSHLDYCSQGFVAVNGWLLDKLQSLQNAAAHLVTRARKFVHINTPVKRKLHWLLVWHRLKFKMAFLVLKCPCCLATVYLVVCYKPTSINTGHSHLRSANLCQLSVPTNK